MTYTAKDFRNTVVSTYFAGDYSGVTHAGLAILAADTGRVLLAQRAMDETDDEDVQETWEWPGGHIDGDETPMEAALREYSEEVVLPLPEGEVINGWRAGPEDNYQGFVYLVDEEFSTREFVSNEETQAVGWFDRDGLRAVNLRPEMDGTDWDMIFDVSGNEEAMTAAIGEPLPDEGEYVPLTEPDLTWSDIAVSGIPVHGVLAPEEVPTGDGRGFNAGSMTSRPGILPFSWQKAAIGGHDGSVVLGGLTRLMRKDGLIHWEGMLMPSEEAGEFAGLLAFFGRFGVSVDGDMGSLDSERSQAEGMMWFDAVRSAGLTAVAIPAFHEAYVAFGPHPEMPAAEDALTASMVADGDLVTFDRGPGWVTHPTETNRIHDYWTKPGEPGYAKIGWGTSGDFTRAKKLIGAKIAANSPEDMRYLNQIIAQWHHDALGYWPGELGKPGNAPNTPENRRRAATHASLDEHEGLAEALTRVDNEGITATDDGWEAVLVSSVSGNRVTPPLSYFHRHPDTGATVIEDPDENGIRRTYGYAAQWGVCHIGFDGRCVEPPRTYADDYPEFHLGLTDCNEGSIPTGVLTYGVGHRDAEEILSESPEQAYFDNINNAWASVRVGEDEVGIWYSGVVLPGVPEDHITKIKASGQVSGEWKHGAMRACLTVNVPGFPVQRPSVTYDSDGNVMALAAAAYGGVTDSPCEPSVEEKFAALRKVWVEDAYAVAKDKFEQMRKVD